MPTAPLQLRDVALWRRLLLVALTGAVPLFIVSLTLIRAAYTDTIDFAVRERRGIVLERPLEQLLDLLPRYQRAAQRALAPAATATLELEGGAPQQLARQIELSLAALRRLYEGEDGRALHFDEDPVPAVDEATVSGLEQRWRQLSVQPGATIASGAGVDQMLRDVRGLIRQAGDRSSLILDDDLESYYLADIALDTLPDVQQRLADAALLVSSWLRDGTSEPKREEIAALLALLERDAARIQRGARVSAHQSARRAASSAPLRARLLVDTRRFDAATRTVLELLARARRLVVEDSGHGMDEATLQRIFEPFFTTKPAGEGTGLGLSVVHGLIKDHNGVIDVRSARGRGTTFTLYFPMHSGAVLASERPKRPASRGAGQRVAFVDDEPALRVATKKMLERLGYEPVVFESSSAVWEKFRGDPGAFAALVSDLTMPGLSGLELAQRILELRPGFPILLASGFGGNLTRTEARQLGIADLLSKPVELQTLGTALERALGRPS